MALPEAKEGIHGVQDLRNTAVAGSPLLQAWFWLKGVEVEMSR